MTNIDSLKKVKVPLWAHWLGWYRARQRRRVARKEIYHIATVYAWTYWTDLKRSDYQWYICSVDGTGKRSYEFGTNSSLLKGKEKACAVYASVIVPWVLNSATNAWLINYAKLSIKDPSKAE